MNKKNSFTVERTIHADREGLIAFFEQERNRQAKYGEYAHTQKDKAFREGVIEGIDTTLAVLKDWQEV